MSRILSGTFLVGALIGREESGKGLRFGVGEGGRARELLRQRDWFGLSLLSSNPRRSKPGCTAQDGVVYELGPGEFVNQGSASKFQGFSSENLS